MSKQLLNGSKIGVQIPEIHFATSHVPTLILQRAFSFSSVHCSVGGIGF